MAEEERGGVQNVWLLLIALGLGLVVVLIYNVHIYNVRQEGRGQMIRLLRVTRDLSPGDRLKPEDVAVKLLPKQFEGTLGNVVDEDNQDSAVGSVVNQPVNKDQWLLWEHITAVGGPKPANVISQDHVALAVALDSRLSPGDILRPNDRVNIMGQIPVGQQIKTYCIVPGARVLAVGGAGIQPGKGGDRGVRTGGTPKSYRSITVELPQDESIKWANVLTYVSGSCWVELLKSPIEKTKEFGRVNPQLKDLFAAPSKAPKAEDYE